MRPRGIWKRNESEFIVPYEKAGDTTKTKTFHDMDDAKSFLATVRETSSDGCVAPADVDGGLVADAVCIDE